jgi:hypothetical protein
MAENAWKLQDAKARFSEVVRLAKEKGAQPVTKHERRKSMLSRLRNSRN